MTDEKKVAAVIVPPPPEPKTEPIPQAPEPIKYPGKIAYAHDRGHFRGCASITIETDEHGEVHEKLNQFFEKHPEMLLVEIIVISPATDKMLIIYTKTLDENEREVLQLYGGEIHAKVQERIRKRDEQDLNNRAEQLKRQKEIMRLAEVGKTCEHHHAALIGEKRKERKGK